MYTLVSFGPLADMAISGTVNLPLSEPDGRHFDPAFLLSRGNFNFSLLLLPRYLFAMLVLVLVFAISTAAGYVRTTVPGSFWLRPGHVPATVRQGRR